MDGNGTWHAKHHSSNMDGLRLLLSVGRQRLCEEIGAKQRLFYQWGGVLARCQRIDV